MNDSVTRRRFLRTGGAAGSALAAASLHTVEAAERTKNPDALFRLCLNTSTLRGHKLPVNETLDIAADAGFRAVELWVDEIERFLKAGGSTKDLKTQLADRGLAAVGAIAFHRWMVDDQGQREKALEQAERHMGMLAEIGCTHIAAPPCGNVAGVSLLAAAERYRALLEIGDRCGVVPAVEVWGFAKNLHRLGQAVCVAIETHHPKACILPDVFHLYTGGSKLADVRKLNPVLLAGFHMNDYPADPPRDKIRDKNRIYPGDGIAPLKQLVRDLRAIGYAGPLSVELFNPEHAKQDPKVVAKTSFEKLRAVVGAALG